MRSRNVEIVQQLVLAVGYIWLTSRMTPLDWWVGQVFIATQVIWVGGGIAALLMPTSRAALWMMLLGALGPLSIGTFTHGARLWFIIQNGGMEAANGMGSPVAFLIGWAFTTAVFFLPGLIFSGLNALRIIRLHREEPGLSDVLT